MYFFAEEAQHTAYLLQRNMPTAKLFDDENFDQVSGRIDAVAAVSPRHNDALFIPPLQLARCDASQVENIAGGEAVCQHKAADDLKHFGREMFDAILNPAMPGVNASVVSFRELSYSLGNRGH